MRRLILSAGALASVAALATAPQTASARPYYHHHHTYYRSDGRCEHNRNERGAVGAVSGTVGGAIIGGSLSHGAGGALLGAGLGALAGNQIGKHWHRC